MSLVALHAIAICSTEFLFKAYDTNGTGTLTRDKLYEYFVSSLHMNVAMASRNGSGGGISGSGGSGANDSGRTGLGDCARGGGDGTAPPATRPSSRDSTLSSRPRGGIKAPSFRSTKTNAGIPGSGFSSDAAAILRDFSDRVFRAVDAEGKGVISLSEAIRYVEMHEEISDVASIFGRCMVSDSDADPTSILAKSGKLHDGADPVSQQQQQLSSPAATGRRRSLGNPPLHQHQQRGIPQPVVATPFRSSVSSHAGAQADGSVGAASVGILKRSDSSAPGQLARSASSRTLATIQAGLRNRPASGGSSAGRPGSAGGGPVAGVTPRRSGSIR